MTATSRVPVAAAALITVQIAWWAYMALPGYFRVDDYVYLADIRLGHFSLWHWLGTVYFQHFAPGHRLAFWLLGGATPGAWLGIELFLLALFAIGLASFYGTLELLFGRSWWLLVPLAVAGFGYQYVWGFVWPSAGLQVIPSFAFSNVCLYAYLRRYAGGGRGWLALSALAFTIGLAFYVRVLLVLLVIVAVRVLFLEPSPRARALVRSLWRERWSWVVLLAPALVYVWWYRHIHAFGTQPPFSNHQFIQYVRTAWLRNIAPGLLGVEIGDYVHLPLWKHVVEAGAQLLFVAAFVFSIARKRAAALRAWAYLALVLAATFVLTAKGKLGVAGPYIAYDMRYVADLIWQIPLGVVFALHPRRTLVVGAPWPAAQARAARPAWTRPALAAGVAGATALMAFAALHSANWRQNWWGGAGARQFAEHARSSLHRLAAQGHVAQLSETVVPASLIEGFGPSSTYSHVLPLFNEPVRVEAPGGPNAIVTPGGTVVPARGHPIAVWRLPHAGPAGGGRVERRAGVACVVAGAGAPAVLETDQPLHAKGSILWRLALAGPLPGGTNIAVNTGQGWPEQPNRWFAPDPPGRAVVDTLQTSIAGIRLYVPAGATLCVRGGRFEELLPAQPSSSS